jgi:hypothetical protein
VEFAQAIRRAAMRRKNRARRFSFCPLAQGITDKSADAAGILGYEK